MDLESTIETIVSYIPEDLEAALSDAASLIPADLDFLSTAKFLLLFAGAALLIGFLGRMFLGRRSSLNHSLSSAMGILFIYAVTIVCYTFQHWNLDQFLSPLPFVTFSGDCMIVLPLQGAELTAVCREIVAMVILAFLVNLLDTFLPRGNSVLGWYLLRFVTVVLAMLLHLVVRWAFDTYLPDVLVTYAPTILLGILVAMLLMGALNLLLSLVLTVVNPILGALYSFFFSNLVGKQLTKAVFTTAILCVVVFLVGHFGFTVINISAAALTSYIPLAAVSLILWYVIGHIL